MSEGRPLTLAEAVEANVELLRAVRVVLGVVLEAVDDDAVGATAAIVNRLEQDRALLSLELATINRARQEREP